MWGICDTNEQLMYNYQDRIGPDKVFYIIHTLYAVVDFSLKVKKGKQQDTDGHCGHPLREVLSTPNSDVLVQEVININHIYD